MVFFNYSTMQMAAKVVYYGPGLCGKTTNLQWIFDHTSGDSRGEMVSLATETDRTLFFDLLPIDVGSIAGFSTRIQLYTVPGQVFYNTTRKLVLKGVDGVVFVADSQRPMLQANIESFHNLEENLAEMGLSLENIPLVLQYNKRDLPGICSVEELNQALNRGPWPSVESSALNGTGVFETLKTVSKMTLLALKKRLTKGRSDTPRAAKTGPRPAVTPKTSAAPREEIAAASPAPSGEKPATSPASPAPQEAQPATAAAETAPSPSESQSLAPAIVQPDPGVSESQATLAEEVSGEAAVEFAAEIAPEATKQSAEEADKEAEKDTLVSVQSPAPVNEPTVAKEPKAASTAPAGSRTGATEVIAARAEKRRPSAKPRGGSGIDALAELEKIRQQALHPNAKPELARSSYNGHEIRRSLQVQLSRQDFSRARRVSLSLQIEDSSHQVVDEVRHLHVDIDDASSLERLLLRLNIAVDPSA